MTNVAHIVCLSKQGEEGLYLCRFVENALWFYRHFAFTKYRNFVKTAKKSFAQSVSMQSTPKVACIMRL